MPNPTKPTKKSRTVNDPRVARAMRAIDAVIASPHVDDLLLSVVESLLTFGDCCHRYRPSDGWTPETARASVLALALAVPEPMLEELADVADREHKHVTWWDRRGHLEAEVVPPQGMTTAEMTVAQLKRAIAKREASAA